ncbi:hypothetical protein [Subtercola boreus]|uniref:HTH araC/xylS-type domain-containing protein n=1 Tax=Subtercola boreus TaxID=120213 RepID=A0A3E0W9F5_9MICO|nr:hypothetical protein [Subtercola boreus]RFA19020.1 hypothetical protein B7R24_12840 [Subtercola boreus]RFA19158.1 hypothetical protein B7R23_12820 [Subtercola boreus]RFA25620.1 hypothetical protein B7R25_12940 [Subtercola boreus]
MTASTRAHFDLSGAEGLSLAEGNVSSDDPEGFWMRGAHWSFGDVLLSDLSFSPAMFGPAAVRDGGFENSSTYLSVAFLLEGEFTITDGEAHLRFLEGTAAYLTGHYAIAAANPAPSHVLIVSVTCEELANHGIHPRGTFGGLSYSALLRDPLLPFLQTLLPIIQHNSIPTEPTATILAQLVAGLFIADEGQVSSGRLDERRLRNRAESVISRSFTDRAFTPAVLAHRLGIRIDELKTVFDDTGSGETIAATIESRRLTSAISKLSTPNTDAAPSMVAAATSSGFSGLAALERAVQATYGVSTIRLLTGFRRLNEADYLDQGGVQQFVSRVRGNDGFGT